MGPHPYPYLVRELQAVIGREARAQMLEQAGGLPDVAVACVGGGSNAIGLFHPFLGDAAVKLIGVEAGGRGPGLGDNAASLTFGTPGVLQGSYTLILQDAYGQVRETHSVSAGLDYSGVGPEHAYLMKSGRVAYESATDDEALDALAECAKFEGILPAIESAHAFFGARRYAAAHPGARILIGCSGRGDKDMPILQRTLLKDLAHEGSPMNEALTTAPRDTIAAAIQAAVSRGRPALVGFLTAGFPTRRAFKDNLAAVAGVCDVVEIGVPFSDPMADGTTVQRASFVALNDGVTLAWILEELQSVNPRHSRAHSVDELFEPAAQLRLGRPAARRGGRRVSPDSSFRTCLSRKAAT